MDEAIALLTADPARTAIITDFDGTLAEIVDDPELARPLPGATLVLADLAVRYGLVAVVSGRPAAFLAEHLLVGGSATPRPRLVGLYGLEWVGPDGSVVADPAAEAWRPVVARAADRGAAELGDPSAVERKGLTVTFHWRRRPDLEPAVERLVADLADETGLSTHPAKMSIELRPPLEVDKGTAVAGLIGRYPAACYLGDDLGDLPAFAALEELAAAVDGRTVRVAVLGPESPEALSRQANLAVDGPHGALGLLQELAREPGSY